MRFSQTRCGALVSVAQLAGAKDETGVVGVPARVGVCKRGNQHGAGMRRHMQPVRNQGQRTEHAATDDFDNHHQGAEDNHGPRLALVLLVPGAQEHVVMAWPKRGVVEVAHC